MRKKISPGDCSRRAILSQIEANRKNYRSYPAGTTLLVHRLNIPRIIFSSLTKIWGKKASNSLLVAACLLAVLVAPAAAQEEILPGQVLDEINLARTEPLKYSEYLRELRKQYHDNSYLVPGTDIVVETIEGLAAVDEAIHFFADRKPLPPLVWSAGLAASAAELVREQSKSGVTGHAGKRSGGLSARTKHQGIRQKSLGENIAYGPNSPRAMVIDLIIDDGVPNRGHRKNLFNSTFKKAGVSCGIHPLYETMCVIDFSR